MKNLAALLIVSVPIIAACTTSQSSVGVEKGMIDAIQTYATGAYSANLGITTAATCQQDVAGLKDNLWFSSNPVHGVGNYDASGIAFTVQRRVGDVVQLKIVSGEGTMGVILPAFGQLTPQPTPLLPPNVKNAIVLSKENDSWKICFGAANVLLGAPAPSPDTTTTAINTLTILFNFVSIGFTAVVLTYFSLRLLTAPSRSARRQENIRLNGITTKGEVTALGTQSNMTYRYTVPVKGDTTKTFERTVQINSQDYGALTVGDVLTVRYLQDRPNDHIILDGARETTIWTGVIVLGLVILAVGLFAIGALFVSVFSVLTRS